MHNNCLVLFTRMFTNHNFQIQFYAIDTGDQTGIHVGIKKDGDFKR